MQNTENISLQMAKISRKHTAFFRTQCSCTHLHVLAWHSGKNVGLGRQTFPVARSTFSWWVTTYVGKPSAGGQPTKSTQPFILSGSINEWWAAIKCSLPQSVEAQSGERLRGKGRYGVSCTLNFVIHTSALYNGLCTMQGTKHVLCFTFIFTFMAR